MSQRELGWCLAVIDIAAQCVVDALEETENGSTYQRRFIVRGELGASRRASDVRGSTGPLSEAKQYLFKSGCQASRSGSIRSDLSACLHYCSGAFGVPASLANARRGRILAVHGDRRRKIRYPRSLRGLRCPAGSSGSLLCRLYPLVSVSHHSFASQQIVTIGISKQES